ncbi:MAG: MnmC family methyltransferase [Campylobacterales bacterium]|nr:MnmC family methyltransferase [Campylobacterales bacterium]
MEEKLQLKKTRDGSFTIYSKEYNEHYHSVKDGALKESLYKHVIPGFDRVKGKDEINILDICFGIGFNTLTTLYYAKQIGFLGKINIYSPELNKDLIRSLKLLPYPKEFLEFLPTIYEISQNYIYQKKNINIEVFPGDATQYVKKFQNKLDIVYQDAFSSKKNPELWSEEFFSDLYKGMKKNGILTTYSQAKGVRHTMESVGFTLDEQKIDNSLTIRSGTLGYKY